MRRSQHHLLLLLACSSTVNNSFSSSHNRTKGSTHSNLEKVQNNCYKGAAIYKSERQSNQNKLFS
uniref:Secreted protein n=1 Tax=Setaria italica TaxID=4555 RepID=K3Y0Q0_SETIT